MERWSIGFPPWVVPDGTYEDVQRGQRVDFAVEFFPHEIVVSNNRTKSATLVEDWTYYVNAEVIYLTEDAWVLDFGLMAYQSPPGLTMSPLPDGIIPWSFVAAKLELGVDTYPYFEFLYALPTIPALIYSWRVEQITMWSAPYVEGVGTRGEPCYVWDRSGIARQTVDSTSEPNPVRYTPGEWFDTPGGPMRSILMSHCLQYILHCAKIDSPPRRSRSDWSSPGAN